MICTNNDCFRFSEGVHSMNCIYTSTCDGYKINGGNKMNQQQKEIAGILKCNIVKVGTNVDLMLNEKVICIAKSLADLFEKEDKKVMDKLDKDANLSKSDSYSLRFNRQDFLKLAGVKE